MQGLRAVSLSSPESGARLAVVSRLGSHRDRSQLERREMETFLQWVVHSQARTPAAGSHAEPICNALPTTKPNKNPDVPTGQNGKNHSMIQKPQEEFRAFASKRDKSHVISLCKGHAYLAGRGWEAGAGYLHTNGEPTQCCVCSGLAEGRMKNAPLRECEVAK